MKIHIIDDNTDVTTMLLKYFTIQGHSCSVSNDGHSGLSMISTNRYDAIILDLAMPEFSGADLVDSLYKNGKAGELNIVAFTASSVSDETEEELKKKGVKAILRKPIDPDELLDYLLQLQTKPVQGTNV